MDFADSINALAIRAKGDLSRIQTEEATKTTFVMPFIQALGYDVFNVDEVHPEYVADVGIKKGEKVDYAIMIEGKPAILFECKMVGENLDNAHASQLYRYYTSTDARFGVLTNGIEYRFFTDLDQPNIMDKKPFLTFSLLDPKEPLIEELKKFSKDVFDEARILSTASQLKYVNEIKQLLAAQLANPEEEFVRFFASRIYTGIKTAPVIEQFTTLTRHALRQYVNDQIAERFKSALAGKPDQPLTEVEDEEGTKVATTLEEHEGYLIVRAILRKVVDAKRVIMRDTQSYCGILLDDNNRKPICRLHFNHSQKYIGLIDADKNETRHPINSIDDIYQHAEHLREAIGYYAGDTQAGDA